jgi:hypothetical protein
MVETVTPGGVCTIARDVWKIEEVMFYRWGYIAG